MLTHSLDFVVVAIVVLGGIGEELDFLEEMEERKKELCCMSDGMDHAREKKMRQQAIICIPHKKKNTKRSHKQEVFQYEIQFLNDK